MIGFWLTVVVVSALAMALVVFPLLRRRAPALADRAAYDLTVYQDQLAEIDRDVERGLLLPDRAEAARLEIKRRMLSAGPVAAESPARPLGRSPMLASVLTVLVPLGALALYWDLGHPGAGPAEVATDPQAPSQQAPSQQELAMRMEEAVAQLQQRLDQDPGNLEGWLLLGRSYLSLGRPADAVIAYRTAAGLSGQRADVLSDYAEALVAAEEGRVTPMADTLFRRALAGDPADTKARYYIALGEAQRGDLEGALQGWTDVLALSPADAPWVPTVREQRDRAAGQLAVDPGTIKPSPEVQALVASAPNVAPQQPGPSAEDVAAAEQMSPEQRAAMVRAMVERLAARLEDDPDNLEGWLRLADAYEVIGEPDKAREARARAEALRRQ